MEDRITFGFDEANNSPGYLLWQVTMLWQRKIKRELDKLNITHTQFVLMSVLAWLSQQKSDVTQTDIADRSKTDRMMVSKVLRTLEQKGMIARNPHPTDTRANIVLLTKKGHSALQDAVALVEEVDRDFFKADRLVNEKLLLLIENNE